MTNETQVFPCGKCYDCLKRRASGWSFRLMQEEKKSHSALFLTLTYDTKHVPITRNGFMCLNKRDLQLFMKRLRKTNRRKLKYYAVGEYGGKTMRPHFHIILFNADIKTIQPAWMLGHIHYGKVSGASVGYTLKYMCKPSRIPLHRNDDRLSEFSLMSKGLGASYLSPQMKRWHLSDMDKRMYCNIEDGKKIAMPRYYKDKLYTEQQRKRIAYFARKEMLERERELLKDPDYFNKKAIVDKAQFAKMHHQALTGRNKI